MSATLYTVACTVTVPYIHCWHVWADTQMFRACSGPVEDSGLQFHMFCRSLAWRAVDSMGLSNPVQTMVLIDQNASQQCIFSDQNLCCAPRSVEMRRPSETLRLYILAMIYEPASTPISPVWRQRVTESCTIEKQIHFLH